MSYYPAMLDLRHRKVLFIGGGWETEHKVKGLLAAGARVTLVSSHVHVELDPLAQDGTITWHRRGYQPGDLEGFWLVMSHPVSKADNAPVYEEAEARGILCNCVDDPERCSFILPSVHRQGDLVIGISTSGTAPALGVRIKQKLAQEYGPEYKRFLELLRSMRPSITAGFSDFEARKQLWYALIDSAALELVRQDRLEEAWVELERVIQARREQCQRQPCASCTTALCQARHALEVVA